jgi:hypothetical protein
MDTDPARAAERQLDAYNARDAGAFAECYHPEVEVFELPGLDATIRGREALRERYARLFERHPRQRCRVLHRIVHGRFVVDHEEVEGRGGGGTVRAVAIYEVEEGTIRRVWFLKNRRDGRS